MTLREIMEDAWQNSHAKGWYDKPRSFGDEIALMHSELSEALEAYRDGYLFDTIPTDDKGKPLGIASELADTVIRIAEVCRERGIPLEQAIKQKLAYNRTRPHRHGEKIL